MVGAVLHGERLHGQRAAVGVVNADRCFHGCRVVSGVVSGGGGGTFLIKSRKKHLFYFKQYYLLTFCILTLLSLTVYRKKPDPDPSPVPEVLVPRRTEANVAIHPRECLSRSPTVPQPLAQRLPMLPPLRVPPIVIMS